MTNPAADGPRRLPTKALAAAGAVLGLVILLLYMSGTIGGHKVAPGTVPLPAGATTPGTAVAVEKREVADVVEWPGTVTSRLVANLAPKVMARVLAVHVNVGALVKAGDPIATLDDRDIRARAQQASAALVAAEAQARQAEADERRTRTLFDKQAATRQDLDAADARAKAARAQVAQAKDAVTEAQVMLGETNVRAPFAGVVASRMADPGDMAAPGRPLAVVHDPAALRLEVRVAEQCVGHLAVGMDVPARIATLPAPVPVRIEEIAPAADPASRTFLVKAALPASADLRPGTYGNLQTPCGTHVALLIPAAAVIRTGQLESVRRVADGGTTIRLIRTGKTYADQVEVLSGLAAGDRILLGGSVPR